MTDTNADIGFLVILVNIIIYVADKYTKKNAMSRYFFSEKIKNDYRLSEHT